MFELFLSKTPNKEASPAIARKPRHPEKKFSSHFLICARRFFSSKRKRKLFCGVLLLTSRTAGLSAFCICSGVAEFPPPFRLALASDGDFFGGLTILFLAPPSLRGKDKGTPFFLYYFQIFW